MYHLDEFCMVLELLFLKDNMLNIVYIIKEINKKITVIVFC